MHRKISIFLLALCILLAFYIAFYNLGKAPLDNWDEAWYGEVTKQILKTKEFIVLYWNHAVWLDKPPMYMWVSALFSLLLGLSEFSVRLPSAISGFFLITYVFLASYRSYGIVPSLFAFSSLALNNVFIWRVRSGNIDAFSGLLIFLTYLLLMSKNRYKYPLLGLIFACIYLTKASLVFFPLVVFFLHELIYQRDKLKENIIEYVKVFLIFFLLSGLWLFGGYLKVGPEFVQYYLFQVDQGVGNVALSKFNADYIDFVYYSLQRRLFWVLLLGIIFALRFIKDRKYFLILSYGFLLFLHLSFTERSNNWYLVPSMPFWAILIAFGVYQFLRLFRRSNIFVIAIMLALLTYVSYKTFTENIVHILNTTSAKGEAQSGKKIKSLTKEDETIVRIDHLYPATIYYSDRRVLSSPPHADTKKYWITRSDLREEIKKKKITWIVGTAEDIEQFKKENSDLQFREIPVKKEVILKAM